MFALYGVYYVDAYGDHFGDYQVGVRDSGDGGRWELAEVDLFMCSSLILFFLVTMMITTTLFFVLQSVSLNIKDLGLLKETSLLA